MSREFSCHAILSLLRLRLQKPFERKSRRFVVCATRFNRILDNVSSFHSFFPLPTLSFDFLRFESFYIYIYIHCPIQFIFLFPFIDRINLNESHTFILEFPVNSSEKNTFFVSINFQLAVNFCIIIRKQKIDLKLIYVFEIIFKPLYIPYFTCYMYIVFEQREDKQQFGKIPQILFTSNFSLKSFLGNLKFS